jgi:hypothetical protein
MGDTECLVLCGRANEKKGKKNMGKQVCGHGGPNEKLDVVLLVEHAGDFHQPTHMYRRSLQGFLHETGKPILRSDKHVVEERSFDKNRQE